LKLAALPIIVRGVVPKSVPEVDWKAMGDPHIYALH